MVIGEEWILAGVFAVGLASGFIGGVAGGGGFISTPLLIFMGLTPPVAIATNKLGEIGLCLSTTIEFARKGKIVWVEVIPMCVIAAIGSIIGAQMLLDYDTSILPRVVGFAILFLLPLVFVKDVGLDQIEVTASKKFIGFLLFLLVMIYGGFFGAGVGVLSFYVLMVFMGYPIIEANGTYRIPSLVMVLTALYMFFDQEIINYQWGITLGVGMLVGGFIGAHMAVVKGNRWVRTFFSVVVVLSGVKLMFF